MTIAFNLLFNRLFFSDQYPSSSIIHFVVSLVIQLKNITDAKFIEIYISLYFVEIVLFCKQGRSIKVLNCLMMNQNKIDVIIFFLKYLKLTVIVVLNSNYQWQSMERTKVVRCNNFPINEGFQIVQRNDLISSLVGPFISFQVSSP